MNPIQIIDEYITNTFPDKSFWQDVQNSGKFAVWSGSDSPDKHHYGRGGLAQHTMEVIKLGFSTKQALNLEFDDKEWIFAALFHDLGKTYDYVPVEGKGFHEWVKSDHKRLIHHISRSAIMWSKIISNYSLYYDDYHDKVLHAILSHHGLREWGSPVAPKTRVAWLLHLCDGISARMNDCDKHDCLKI